MNSVSSRELLAPAARVSRKEAVPKFDKAPAARTRHPASALFENPIFHDEAAATAYVQDLRWPQGPFCPFCRETRDIADHGEPGAPMRFSCGGCRRSFGATSGTMLAASAVSLPKWLRTLQLLAHGNDRTVASSLMRMFALTSTDPDLRLIVDGRTVKPVCVDHLIYSFNVPASPAEIRIMSRHVVPAELYPSSNDRRRLGVSLGGICLEAASRTTEYPADDPALVEGFHRAEEGLRWTNGRALLPASFYAEFTTGFVVRIRLTSAFICYTQGV